MAGTGTQHLRKGDTVLRVEGLTVEHRSRGRVVHAVSGVSFDLVDGETLGIVGESGCGKSSAGRAVLQLPPPTSGSVRFEGREMVGLSPRALRELRARIQMVFQDPISSLDPARRVGALVSEPVEIWQGRRAARDHTKAREMLEAVGLDPDQVWDRRPRELSGGQCQRVCIARILMLDARVVICDEPVSALDVSVQAQILNLLEDTKRRYGLSLVFIAHDLGVVRNVSDRVLVMYLGKMCEIATSEDLYARPAHPYTQVLLASIPEPDPDRELAPVALRGELPSAADPPSGCRFRTRCPRADERCAAVEPLLTAIGPDHWVACHHPGT
jgi:peptide/nickel transport system ATP-binding protein